MGIGEHGHMGVPCCRSRPRSASCSPDAFTSAPPILSIVSRFERASLLRTSPSRLGDLLSSQKGPWGTVQRGRHLALRPERRPPAKPFAFRRRLRAGMVDQAHVRSCRTRLRGLTGRGAQMAAR